MKKKQRICMVFLKMKNKDSLLTFIKNMNRIGLQSQFLGEFEQILRSVNERNKYRNNIFAESFRQFLSIYNLRIFLFQFGLAQTNIFWRWWQFFVIRNPYCLKNLFHYNRNMTFPYVYFYLVPEQVNYQYVSQFPVQFTSIKTEPVSSEESGGQSTSKSKQFLILFQEELRQTSIKYIKKVWSRQEDQQLIILRDSGFKWTDISKKFSGSNPQTCKRRYQRLKQDQDKWPEPLEQEMKIVCSRDDLKWEEKVKILYSKFPGIAHYSKKMIKERYLTYLEQNIEQKQWSIEEDMILIKMLSQGTKRWKAISKSLPGRTQLHLKNRYYGCLRAIQQKVNEKLQKRN